MTAVALGVGLGCIFRDRPIALGVGTRQLGDVGLLVIRSLKTLATPLIFLAVIDAVLRTHIPRRKGLLLVLLSGLNAVVAVSIGLGVADLLRSGRGQFAGIFGHEAAHSPADTVLHSGSGIAGIVPDNLIDPFRENRVIAVVMVALAFGLALRAVRTRGGAETKTGLENVAVVVQALLRACTQLLGWVIELLPFAVGGVVSHAVGKHGLSVLLSLVSFVATILLGLLLHAVVYYGLLLRFVARRSLREFWSGASDAVTTAWSCGSSLATLPVTLGCLEKMKVSASSARLAACVGTNLNHDGIMLYESAAALFVAQAVGAEPSLSSALGVALSSVMAGVGIAGVPEAGLVTLPLVLGAAGIPSATAEAVIPLLLPLDWLLGRFRAATNVTSDLVVATLLERFFPEHAADDEASDFARADTTTQRPDIRARSQAKQRAADDR